MYYQWPHSNKTYYNSNNNNNYENAQESQSLNPLNKEYHRSTTITSQTTRYTTENKGNPSNRMKIFQNLFTLFCYW